VNFFEAQDDARKSTGRLVILFGAAVISLIVLTNLLVAAVYLWSNDYAYGQPQNLLDSLFNLPAETWLMISVGVVGVVGVASLYKFLIIRGGGRVVAESLGGRMLTHDTADGSAKRLLNVVEEMAIASGMPVPPVYLIPESSINAFAAGFGPDDAVIGVNQGTVDHLSRDELQGVIAHEFSHILNGDVSINLRLIAILHGILFIGIIGYGILRGMGRGSRRSNNGAPILALGVGLLAIGYTGTFFGNLIKAAVSRQREYLADAAAVQFTRNPDSIAGALKKIGGLSEGSEMRSSNASEASHMFFGQVRTLFLNSLLATHPPLPKRIRAIDPSWDGEFPLVVYSADHGTEAPLAEGVAGFSGPGQAAGAPVHVNNITVGENAEGVMEKVGTLDHDGLEAARAMIASTDAALRDAAHDPWGCRALIYAILLDGDQNLLYQQFEHLQNEAESRVPAYTVRLVPLLNELDPPRRLTLVEMAMPALKALSPRQYERFMTNVVTLIKMDRVISLPEWVLHRLLVKELRPHFEGPQQLRPKYASIEAVLEPAGTLLSTIARFGHERTEERQAAFAAGAAALEAGSSAQVRFESEDDHNFVRLNDAIRILRLLKPLVKPRLIKACAATALADEQVSGLEGALLQGISAALDCPLPPSIYRAD
jgi:Zn-dependent protease with chaperone function